MATINSLLVEALKGNLGVLQMTLADFSDADMLARPVPGANHAAWQIGHLTVLENMIANLVSPGKVPPMPEGANEKYGKKGAALDDAASFPSKQELLDQYAQARTAIIDFVATATPEDFEKPSPQGFEKWVPTMGRLFGELAGHTAMHVGQFQVIRRKLGKPVLF